MKDEEQMAGKHRTIRSLIYGLIASVCLSAILHAATSSTIVLTPNEKIVGTVNQDSGSISLWNRLELGEVCEVAVGDEPRTLAVSPDGHHHLRHHAAFADTCYRRSGKRPVHSDDWAGGPTSWRRTQRGRTTCVRLGIRWRLYRWGILTRTIAVVDLVKRSCQALSVRASSRRQAPESLRNPLFRTQ